MRRSAAFTRSGIPLLFLLVVLVLGCGISRGFAASLSEDEELLLDQVQYQTLNYFWKYAHPVSGMAAERNTTPDVVTAGGTGFGVMTWIVGAERGWLHRQEVLRRAHRLVDFLGKADRFHGAWPHWLDGRTGKTIPFSEFDDGADLVETSFLMQGLLTLSRYFDRRTPDEGSLRRKIDRLWREVEWDWFTRGEKILYWHWSPRYGWKMNLPIRGYNECLITYVLAASSPSHPIKAEVYHQGWAGGARFVNGLTYFERFLLPLGPRWGGPLFFAHYSFLGLDPRNLKDRYADYWQQNVNHSMINHLYCVLNPGHFEGYSRDCWGLTSSDNPNGYAAHSPANDLGVIAPTAAISSIPYTPDQSMRALKFFFSGGRRFWGECGFYDSFSPEASWYATSYLAIDQGPIILMIENFRTALLWRLFMGNQDVRRGLRNLGFSFLPPSEAKK